jgi:glucosamine-6-phosphate deaminase
MEKLIFKSYEEISSAAADIIAIQLGEKPKSVLGLATGSTPIGLYQEMVKRSKEKLMDFSEVMTFNLDEYYPIKNSHPQSYHTFMHENLFKHVKFAATHVPNGEADDPKAECIRYDAAIKEAGGIDIQVLGIGFNGHIGFNEPSKAYSMATHMEYLTKSTLEANSRFFKNGESQPATALTVGMESIFNAKKILLIISGAGKANIAKKLFDGKIHTDIPASLLLLHPDVTVLMDSAAAGV